MSAARTAIAPEEENKIKVQNPRQRSSGQAQQAVEARANNVITNLARPRLRPARGTRWLDCADRSAAEFSGLANGGTEFLLRDKFHGTTSVLRSPFHWHVHPNGTPSKSDNSRGQVPP